MPALRNSMTSRTLRVRSAVSPTLIWRRSCESPPHRLGDRHIGQIEMDRGDRDATIGERAEIGARISPAPHLRWADPVERAAARVAAFGQIVAEHPLALMGD